MTRLKPLSAHKIITVLESLGFEKIRQKGSHLFLKHPEGRIIIVPYYKSEDIGRGLLRNIIKDTGLTVDEFLKLI